MIMSKKSFYFSIVLNQLRQETRASLLWYHGAEAYQCDDSTTLHLEKQEQQFAQQQISTEPEAYRDSTNTIKALQAEMVKDPVALQKGWFIYIPRTFEIAHVSNLAKEVSRLQQTEKEFGILLLMNLEADFVIPLYFR